MAFKILYLTSTSTEAGAVQNLKGFYPRQGGFSNGKIDVDLLVSGVGTISTLWNLSRSIYEKGKPDLAINGGIAGSFRKELVNGSVVMPVTDRFADQGIEDGDYFMTLEEAGLADPDEFPYKKGLLVSEGSYQTEIARIIQPVNAVTVGTGTGSQATVNKLISKFNPDIETMEGAAFFYLCIREDIPFLAIRAVSNFVERRNRNNWDIPGALRELGGNINKVMEIIGTMV